MRTSLPSAKLILLHLYSIFSIIKSEDDTVTSLSKFRLANSYFLFLCHRCSSNFYQPIDVNIFFRCAGYVKTTLVVTVPHKTKRSTLTMRASKGAWTLPSLPFIAQPLRPPSKASPMKQKALRVMVRRLVEKSPKFAIYTCTFCIKRIVNKQEKTALFTVTA